jgi:hypothetical protein
MARLVYTYADLYRATADFLGISASDTLSLTKCKQLVDSGYANFVGSHKWSFLKKLGFMTTITNQWQYGLPEDFVRFTNSPNFAADAQYSPLVPVSYDELMNLRLVSDYTAWPAYYTIVDGVYTPEVGTIRELLLYPTPAAAYQLNYQYESFPVKMVKDADLPVGGPEFAEVVRAFCLAEAELAEENAAKVWANRLSGMLSSAIQRDNRRHSTWNLGYFGDGAYRDPRSVNRVTRINNVSYEVD